MKKYFCAECGKPTRVKKPKNGDGSLLLPVAHYIGGSAQILCPGSWEEAEERTVHSTKSKKKK